MKRTIVVAMLLLMLDTTLYAQSGSINNTLGSGGTFTIKDGSTTFLSLSQSTGSLNLNNTLTLPTTTGPTVGVIFSGAVRFIHNYWDNTFVGINSGNFTMSWMASDNTAVGKSTLMSLTTGYSNSAFGSGSLSANTNGIENSAFGCYSLCCNTEARYNSAFGSESLYSNKTGEGNSALGNWSLYSDSTGCYNCGFGNYSLYSNITGWYNSAFGEEAGMNISGTNNTCIGFNAQVPSATSDNQVRIGNTYVTYAGIQVAWTVTSDRRWKSNITASDLGLDFISKLNPVSYTRKNDKKQRSEYGFIAQEIEEVLKEAGVKNAGMLTVDDQGRYELRYNDLLAPMVKAIQELKTENDLLKDRLARFERAQQLLVSEIEKLKSDKSQKNSDLGSTR